MADFHISNVLGSWIAGVGSALTAITSLYLARRDLRIKLKVSVDHRSSVTTPSYCYIRVVNVGFKSVIVTAINWQVGFFRKQYGIQMLGNHPTSSKLPIKLDQGEEACYFIGYVDDIRQPYWISEIQKSFLPSVPKFSPRSIKAQVCTSMGKVFKAKINKGLRQKLIIALKTTAK